MKPAAMAHAEAGPTTLPMARAAGLAALQQRDYRRAAIEFTKAADALPPDPHGNVTADEISLRRDAHLALGRTAEFYAHREALRKPKGMREADFPKEWLAPDGALVKRLLARWFAAA